MLRGCYVSTRRAEESSRLIGLPYGHCLKKRHHGTTQTPGSIRTSAISACHCPSCSRRSCLSTKVRPGRKLRLHTRFYFPFGLRPIGLTEVRLEAPAVGELFEGGVPGDPPLPGRVADGPWPIVETLARVASEVLEGPLMGVQKLTAHAGLVEATAGVAERQDERMQADRPAAEVNARLRPVDLALLARRGLKPHRRPLRRLFSGP